MKVSITRIGAPGVTNATFTARAAFAPLFNVANALRASGSRSTLPCSSASSG